MVKGKIQWNRHSTKAFLGLVWLWSR